MDKNLNQYVKELENAVSDMVYKVNMAESLVFGETQAFTHLDNHYMESYENDSTELGKMLYSLKSAEITLMKVVNELRKKVFLLDHHTPRAVADR